MIKPIKEIMTKKLATISPKSLITDAVKKMCDLKIGTIVVGTKNNITGIFSERDLMEKVINKGLIPDKTLVESVMTENIVCINDFDEPFLALDLMKNNNIRHLIVIDKKEKVSGIISLRDILNSIIDYYKEENEKLEEILLENVDSDIKVIR